MNPEFTGDIISGKSDVWCIAIDRDVVPKEMITQIVRMAKEEHGEDVEIKFFNGAEERGKIVDGTYFDAVVDMNKRLSDWAEFNGTREETLAWLKEHKPADGKWKYMVYMGDHNKYVEVWEYLNMYT